MRREMLDALLRQAAQHKRLARDARADGHEAVYYRLKASEEAIEVIEASEALDVASLTYELLDVAGLVEVFVRCTTHHDDDATVEARCDALKGINRWLAAKCAREETTDLELTCATAEVLASLLREGGAR